MASDQRWTEETLELVASRGAGAHAAHDILDALASAGVLLPPGGETREEQRHQPRMRPDGSFTPCEGPDLRCTVADHLKARTVWTSPWAELPDA